MNNSADIDNSTSWTTTDPTDDGMATAEMMNYVTSVYVGIIFVIFGVVGNVLSIIVWRRPRMRSSTGTYLTGQAVADLCLLIFFFLLNSLQKIAPSVMASSAYGEFFAYIGYPFFFLFVVCSIWFTVGVTVDRYIQVCWITRAKDMCNERRARMGLGVITLLCFIINAPHFATYEHVTGANPSFRATEYGSGKGSQNYEFWIHCMILVLVPWATIFTLNMLIIHRVTSMNRQMDSKRGSSGKDKTRKSEAQLTRLLLTITFTFLVLIAFQCITQCFFMLKAGNHRIVAEAFSIAQLGIVINSSINFFLYCLSGKRFRKELRIVVCSRFHGDYKSSSSLSMSHSTGSSAISRKTAVTEMPSKV
ncbi:FMRFamide receptor-like [Mya arenaria]|uniref:FMRFamide receptor-like n=1 Tax=Mya arenaria TaxID=6604 RepID=UPI0022E3B005|nr:FMRFamide receptor-like [Mya arenaria]